MKISEGMYVRTKYRIKKIESIVCGQDIKFDNTIGFDESLKKHHDYDGISIYDNYFWNNEIIGKPSYNIIDLIEENDYINGLRVEKNKYGELYTSYVYIGGDVGTQEEVYTIFLKDYDVKFIDNVVTKEQMESMVYEVE